MLFFFQFEDSAHGYNMATTHHPQSLVCNMPKWVEGNLTKPRP